MNGNERFFELWNDYLEGEIDESGLAELRELLASDESLLKIATDTYQTHRLLGLIAEDTGMRHDDFVRETLARLPVQADRFVGGVMQHIGRDSRGGIRSARSRLITWRWALGVAAAVALMAGGVFVFRTKAEPEIARVTGLNGSLQWTGDAGQVDRELAVGRSLSGGTLESQSADSWAELEFRDGSRVTVSGQSMLTISEREQKQLHLRVGKLSASVTPQPDGRPMLIHTSTARMEVLGTQLNVDAEPSSTVLKVNEGRVRVTRLVDGSVAEVPAEHQLIATVNRLAEFNVTRRLEAASSWQSHLPDGVIYGQLVPASDGRPSSVLSTPLLWRNCKQESMVLYVAALSVSRSEAAVALRSGAKFRIRGRMDSAADLLIGLTTNHPKGGFAGKFISLRRADTFFHTGESFDLEFPVEDFAPDESANKEVQSPKSPIGLELYDWWSLTINVDVGLSITSVELIPANSSRD